MNEQRKKKYETPVTKHVQVEVTPEKGQDVATDRHVDINQQIDGGEIDFTKGDSTWE